MNLRELLISVHQALEAAQVQHALIGAFALAHYGIQRATGDIDFLIDEVDRKKAVKALKNLDFRIFHETEEVIQLEGPGSIDFLLTQRPLSRKMLADAQSIQPFNIKCISVEGLIGLKIQAYNNDSKRELQDKADILALIEEHPKMNWNQVKQYADLFNAWKDIMDLKHKVENE